MATELDSLIPSARKIGFAMIGTAIVVFHTCSFVRGALWWWFEAHIEVYQCIG